jgi:hypothetical protein
MWSPTTNLPAAHRLTGRTVFGQAVTHGKKATVYADGMRTTCSTRSGGSPPYAVGHNPWPYFVGERRACRAPDVPGGRLWWHEQAAHTTYLGHASAAPSLARADKDRVKGPTRYRSSQPATR